MRIPFAGLVLAATTTLLATACSGSGSPGGGIGEGGAPDGAGLGDGGTGAGDSAAPDASDGAPGTDSGGADVTPLEPRAGTRLTPITYTDGMGGRIAEDGYMVDSANPEGRCRFQPITDRATGELTYVCVPVWLSREAIYFTDAACSEGVLVVDTLVDERVLSLRVPNACEFVQYAYQIGDLLASAPAQVWQVAADGSCESAALPAGDARALRPADLSGSVTATPVVVSQTVGDFEFRLTYMEGDDGSRAFQEARLGNTLCAGFEVPGGEGACVPIGAPEVTRPPVRSDVLFGDVACSAEPYAQLFGELACELSDFVIDLPGEAQGLFPGQRAIPEGVYRRGEAVMEYYSTLGGCGPNSTTLVNAVHTLDEQIPFETLPALLADGQGSGRLEATLWRTQSGHALAMPTTFFDPDLDAVCEPRETSSGLRCVPYARTHTTTFADAACEQPLRIHSIFETCDELFIGEANDEAQVTAVYRARTYTGSAYSRTVAGACEPDARTRQLCERGAAIDIESLVPLTRDPV